MSSPAQAPETPASLPVPVLQPTEITPALLGVEESAFSYYVNRLREHWLAIAGVVATVTLATVLISLQLPKVYGATALLRVDPAADQATDSQSAHLGQSDATLLTTTEAQIVSSPVNVLGAIHALGLENDPVYRQKIGSLRPGESLDEAMLQLVTKQIQVTQPFNTELMQVYATARTPQMASELANALANAFLQNEYVSRAKALDDASKSMAGQLDRLRSQMEQDQAALVRYQSDNDVLEADATNNIYSARLNQLNTDLSTVEAARIQAEAEDRVAQSASLNALLAIPAGKGLLPLRNQLEADQRVLAHTASIYGPRHPLYLQQESVVQHDRSALAAAQVNLATQIHDQFLAAEEREELVRQALTQEKSAYDAFSRRAIQYKALKAAADSSTQLYNSLQQKMQDAAAAATLRADDLRLVNPALPVSKPVSPHPLINGLLVFVLSTLLCCAAVLVADMMDNTLSNPEQVERYLHAGVIAMLPETQKLAGGLLTNGSGGGGGEAAARSTSQFREAVTSMHSAIGFALGGGPVAVAVLSSVPSEGKSTVAQHLAGVFAALSGATLLIDADLRRPSVHRRLHLPNRQGLTEVLSGQLMLEEAVVEVAPNFSVLTSGFAPGNPAELLHRNFAELLPLARRKYRAVILDCPPVLGFSDTAAFVNLVDGCVLIVSAGRTPRAVVKAAQRQLQMARANLLGVVFNRVEPKGSPYYGYYKDYYAYYRSGDAPAEDAES